MIVHGGPVGLRTAGRRRLVATATKASARFDTAIVDQILGALTEQTVTVPGTEAAQQVLPRLARSLAEVLDQRKAIGAQVEKALDAHPLGEVLTAMPGNAALICLARRRCDVLHAMLRSGTKYKPATPRVPPPLDIGHGDTPRTAPCTSRPC
jgi:hypothetical protein